MKKLYLLSIAIFFISFIQAQNLVPNNSFEIITQCPVVPSRIYYAPPWFQPATWHGNVTNSCSSDLFDTCGSAGTTQGVPQNDWGFQYARTGIGYAGIIPYGDTVNYREYLEVPLLSPLIANHNYCVEFYVSLANLYGTAISNMGAYFSVDSLLDNSYQAHTINYVQPQVENPTSNMLTDTLNWMLVLGSFIANGGESFMTIGNFRLPINTNSQTVIPGNTYGSYYYIDDVSVVDCTSGVGVGGELGVMNYELGVMPNPVENELRITNYELGMKVLKIYNVLGEVVYQCEMSTAKKEIDVSLFSKGIYFVEVSFNTLKHQGIVRKKFVKE